MNIDLKEQAHGEIERIFRILLPQNGLAVREEQIALCHAMLDTLLHNKIALCDAGVGIGKTYAYLTACILLKKFYPSGPAGSQPVVVSTSSVALQDAIIGEYIPFLSRIFLENHIIPKPIRAMVRKGKSGSSAMPVSPSGWRPSRGRTKTRNSGKRCSPFKAIMTWTLSPA